MHDRSKMGQRSLLQGSLLLGPAWLQQSDNLPKGKRNHSWSWRHSLLAQLEM